MTDRQLKSITFQVIPQFYWKYKWSHNEFMIHRVGELDAPSEDLPMYDMLGNVWEWVRDDWTEKISTAFAGKVNPISGTTSAATNPKPKKTIRGGAFDQLVRKVISPSREGLTWDEFKSEYGTQANVGFRPAMVYTEEAGASGGRFEFGSPVDLFFLFDASSTQDDQITEMVAAARKIVGMFATEKEYNKIPDGSDKIPYLSNQGCMVGSALFLGPQIRLMCSHRIGYETLNQFVTLPRVEDDGWTWDGYAGYSFENSRAQEVNYDNKWKKAKTTDGWVEDIRNANIPYFPREDEQDFFKNVERQKPNQARMTAWFKKKFEKNKQDYLESCDADAEEMPKSPQMDEEEPQPTSRSVGIASPGSPGGHGEGAGGKGSYHKSTVVYDHGYFHSGVPVYKVKDYEPASPGDPDGLVFGGLSTSTDDLHNVGELMADATRRMLDGNLKCHDNFFTYNPTMRGKDVFEVPFIQSDKGVLCNWFSGSESVSEVMAQLLGGGFFYGFPWTPAIGYAFRKPSIPKLVFVFTNEYDNEIGREGEDFTDTTSVVAIPSYVPASKSIVFDSARVGYTRIFNKDWLKTLTAFDPYCRSWIKKTSDDTTATFQGKWREYIVKVAGVGDAEYNEKYGGVDGLLERMFELGIQGKMNLSINNDHQTLRRHNKAKWIGLTGQLPEEGAIKEILGYPTMVGRSWDIRRWRQNEVFPRLGTVEALRHLLTDEQVDALQGKVVNSDGKKVAHVLGVDSSPKTKINIDVEDAHTIGFYHLRNVVSNMTNPMACYLFTSDGSVKLKEVEEGKTPRGDDFYLYSDCDMFTYIQSEALPEKMNRTILEKMNTPPRQIFSGPDASIKVGFNNGWTWKTAFLTNLGFWAKKAENVKEKNVNDHAKKTYEKLGTVLGYGDPANKTTIVWAFRTPFDLRALNKNVPKSAGQTYYWKTIVFGLPLLLGRRSDSQAKKEFKDWWNKNQERLSDGMDMQTYADDNGKLVRIASDWKSNKNNCRRSLTVNTGEIYVANVKFDNSIGDWKKDRIKGIEIVGGMTIDKVMSSRSIRRQRREAGGGYNYTWGDLNNPFSFSTGIALDDCITIEYVNDEQVTTGSLKIICFSGNEHISNKENIRAENDHEIVRGDVSWNAFYSLAVNRARYPYKDSFDHIYTWQLVAGWRARRQIETFLNDDKYHLTPRDMDIFYEVSDRIWKDDTFKKSFNKRAKTLREMVPLLMARRFQNQMFDNLKNGVGLSVTDYENKEVDNPVSFRAIPYLDVDNIQKVFQESFSQFDAGRLLQDSRFSATHCVVDLNPDVSKYNEGVENTRLQLRETDFPVQFRNGVDVNADDTYKKDKLVLTRVEAISADGFETFTMGSKSTDYDYVTNENKIKYADSEAMPGQSPQDSANVTLGNGGSFQKKRVDFDLNEYDKLPNGNKPSIDVYNPAKDFYNIYVDKRDSVGFRIPVQDISGKNPGQNGWIPTYQQKRKYFKNRHFFIDPFELTIAQWCHIHGWHTKADARSGLTNNANLDEMRRSYWKYLYTYETGSWNEIVLNNNVTVSNDVEGMLDQLAAKDSRSLIYNPLDDTRPYYYATYKDVRGAPNAYSTVNGSSGSNYVISTKGDEFQMNSRSVTESFMDILNRKAVIQTQRRIYGNGDYESPAKDYGNGLLEYYTNELGLGRRVD